MNCGCEQIIKASTRCTRFVVYLYILYIPWSMNISHSKTCEREIVSDCARIFVCVSVINNIILI